MKKKYFKSAIGIGVGIVLLTVAVFANYESAGGYSTCKNALKKVAFAENFSMDYTADVLIDDGSYGRMFGSYKLAAGENPCLQTKTTEESEKSSYYTKRTIQDEMDIYENFYSGGDGGIGGFIHDRYSNPKSLIDEVTNDAEVGEKLVFWMETIADTLVGDLKNSFVLTSDEGGVKKYNINLSTDQMPSYVTAGVSLFTSIIRNENSVDIDGSNRDAQEPYILFFGADEPYIRDIAVNMSVDDDGNPVQIAGVVNITGYDIDGNKHTMTVDVSMDFYDFDATAIERVPDETIKQLNDYRNETVRTKLAEQAEAAGEKVDETALPERGEAASIGIIGGADGPTAVYVK